MYLQSSKSIETSTRFYVLILF